MKIEITKSEILKEVERQSSLAASMLTGDNAPKYEDIRISEYDGEILDSFWKDGVNAVVQLFIRYISNETVTYDLSTYDGTETLTINADMPDSFNDLLTGSIATGVKMMLACNIMAGWMSVKYPNAAQKYKDDSLGYGNDVRQKLLFRASPAQNRIRDFKTDSVIAQSEDFFKVKDADVQKNVDSDYFSVKSADNTVEKSPDYFGLKNSDSAIEHQPDYFTKKTEETIANKDVDYFTPKTPDAAVVQPEEYFGAKQNDTNIDNGEDYFTPKTPDAAVVQPEEYFGAKQNDNIILKQYENCNINPK